MLQLNHEVVVLLLQLVFVNWLQIESELGLQLLVHIFLEPDGDVSLLGDLDELPPFFLSEY